MLLLDTQAELSLRAIAAAVKVQITTASEHVRRLFGSGLITKHNKGREVLHSLSPLGIRVLSFLRTID